MEAKIENEKYFHNVLCLSEAKGMDIKMEKECLHQNKNMKNAPLPVPNIDAMIDNFDRAVSHPDEQDLEQFRKAVLTSDNYSVI